MLGKTWQDLSIHLVNDVYIRCLPLMFAAFALPAIAFNDPDANASSLPYHPLNWKTGSNHVSSIFDGRQIRMVKIRAITDANTEANRTACRKEWRNTQTYQQLCLNLADHRILHVELVEYPIPVSIRVPVVRIAKVDVGQSALVKMPEITPTNGIKSLPAFVGMLSDNKPRQAL